MAFWCFHAHFFAQKGFFDAEYSTILVMLDSEIRNLLVFGLDANAPARYFQAGRFLNGFKCVGCHFR